MLLSVYNLIIFWVHLIVCLSAPTVRFLREHLEKAGCPVGDNFFKAVNCETKTAGGYTQGQGVFIS